MSQSANHAKAPLCAAFVKGMRDVFGEVEVLYVNENGLIKGRMQPEGAQCTYDGKGNRFPYPQEKKRAA